MGRITRPPPRPKPRFVHEVRVSSAEADQPWLAELLDGIAGPNGYKRRTPFWSYTILSFARAEQAEALKFRLQGYREARQLRERRATGATRRQRCGQLFTTAIIYRLIAVSAGRSNQ